MIDFQNSTKKIFTNSISYEYFFETVRGYEYLYIVVLLNLNTAFCCLAVDKNDICLLRAK
jgi:hypothetical protein